MYYRGYLHGNTYTYIDRPLNILPSGLSSSLPDWISRRHKQKKKSVKSRVQQKTKLAEKTFTYIRKSSPSSSFHSLYLPTDRPFYNFGASKQNYIKFERLLVSRLRNCKRAGRAARLLLLLFYFFELTTFFS